MTEVDVLVIGSGSAGEYAAGTLLAAEKTVAFAENSKVGGDCIFRACIPTKTLLYAAGLYEKMRTAGSYGLPTLQDKADYSKVKAYKDSVIEPLGRGRAESWRKKGAVVLHATARFRSPTEIEIGDEMVRADKTIICTGSRPSVPSIDGLQEAGYITNVEALELTNLPESLAIIGGGPIGIEFGQLFSAFGCHITVYELADHVLPLEDEEVSSACEASMAANGIQIQTKVKLVAVEKTAKGKTLTFEDAQGKRSTATHGEVLVATGRKARFEELNLDAAGVEYDDLSIKVDGTYRTTASNIWAAGDVTGGLMFTYLSNEQGKVAALNCTDEGKREIDFSVFPRATFGSPEVASVGLTEKKAREDGYDIQVGRFDYQDLTRGIATGENEGFFKVVVERESGQLLGAHIIGADASTLIHEAAAAMKAGIPASEIGNLLHVYPTWAEGIRYACQAIA